MNVTKFMEQLSELIVLEMEAVLKSSLRYESGEAKEIVVLTENEDRLAITVR